MLDRSSVTAHHHSLFCVFVTRKRSPLEKDRYLPGFLLMYENFACTHVPFNCCCCFGRFSSAPEPGAPSTLPCPARAAADPNAEDAFTAPASSVVGRNVGVLAFVDVVDKTACPTPIAPPAGAAAAADDGDDAVADAADAEGVDGVVVIVVCDAKLGGGLMAPAGSVREYVDATVGLARNVVVAVYVPLPIAIEGSLSFSLVVVFVAAVANEDDDVTVSAAERVLAAPMLAALVTGGGGGEMLRVSPAPAPAAPTPTGVLAPAPAPTAAAEGVPMYTAGERCLAVNTSKCSSGIATLR